MPSKTPRGSAHKSFRRRCQRLCRFHLPVPSTTAAEGDAALGALLLGPLLGNLPPTDLFQQEVLQRLGPRDIALFAQASHGCAGEVAALKLLARRAKSTTTCSRASSD